MSKQYNSKLFIIFVKVNTKYKYEFSNYTSPGDYTTGFPENGGFSR
jgi:hypothetical protein